MSYELREKGLRSHDNHFAPNDGVEPMANVANIVDVMLVLSVGLMIAIVAYWNVDISNIEEVVAANEMTEVEDIEEMVDETQNNGSSYTELGIVYQDPKTGKMYMLTQDVDKANGANKDTDSLGNKSKQDDK